MANHFCLSATFLDPVFHGRGDQEEPEWPPSPLRAFQALTAAAAARWQGPRLAESAEVALSWLEQQPPPTICAPDGRRGQAIRLSVPNNAMDIVAGFWSRDNYTSRDADPARHRTLKPVCPTHLVDGNTVHFLWELAPADDTVPERTFEVLAMAARSLVSLGWGIDLVAGHARVISEEEAVRLPGRRWCPGTSVGSHWLRCPRKGTLEALSRRHAAFLRRLEGGAFSPVSPLSTFETVCYRQQDEHVSPPYAAFQLLTPDGTGHQAYRSASQTHIVVGMLRNTTRNAALASGWSPDRVKRYVLGHGDGPQGQAHGDARFGYLPLPDFQWDEPGGGSAPPVVADVRRVLLVEMPSNGGNAALWATRALQAAELLPRAEDPDTQPALLDELPEDDSLLKAYVDPSPVWTSVTPVLLPGYDDPKRLRHRLKDPSQRISTEEKSRILERLDNRVESLLRKSIVQTGYPEALAAHAELEWQDASFYRGGEQASRFVIPHHLKKFSRYHVRIHWRSPSGSAFPLAGPVCLGAGRFYGLGLMAHPWYEPGFAPRIPR